jgi:branched-chain amino acid transport system ATP-binding protein
MLTVSHLNAYYGKSHVVRDLSFMARKGRALGLLGRNGVGKTTTLRALMGLVTRNGSASIDERDISALPAHRISRAGLGYIPQGRDLFYHLTVAENLKLAWHGKKFGDKDLHRGIAHFPPLSEMLHREAGTLSGGEQQMVAIGRALLNRPTAILMDEPTEGLSPLFVDRVSAIIREIKAENIAVVLVEQNLALALSVCDDVCFVEKGSIVHSCPVDEAKSPELLERYLGVGVESQPDYGRRS